MITKNNGYLLNTDEINCTLSIVDIISTLRSENKARSFCGKGHIRDLL